MAEQTSDELLILHAVRLLGYADAAQVGARFDRSAEVAEEALSDAEARGWVRRSSFADSSGWSLTEAGQRHGEQLLSAELDRYLARRIVHEVHQRFLPANTVVTEVCTAWQLTELGTGAAELSADEAVDRLRPTAELLGELEQSLSEHLSRFAGYHRRYQRALDQVRTDPAWITAMDRESCHRVWFEFHEDLVATLGLTR